MMKLNFNTDGSYSIDVDSVEQAAELVKQVQKQAELDKNGSKPCNLNALNAAEIKTYEFLVENNCDDGVHFHSFARYAGLTDKAAQQRFYSLLKRGYAVPGSRRGHYRAKD